MRLLTRCRIVPFFLIWWRFVRYASSFDIARLEGYLLLFAMKVSIYWYGFIQALPLLKSFFFYLLLDVVKILGHVNHGGRRWAHIQYVLQHAFVASGKHIIPQWRDTTLMLLWDWVLAGYAMNFGRPMNACDFGMFNVLALLTKRVSKNKDCDGIVPI